MPNKTQLNLLKLQSVKNIQFCKTLQISNGPSHIAGIKWLRLGRMSQNWLSISRRVRTSSMCNCVINGSHGFSFLNNILSLMIPHNNYSFRSSVIHAVEARDPHKTTPSTFTTHNPTTTTNLIIPYFNQSIVGSRDQVWLIPAAVVIYAVDAFFVAL